ncbi:hypothetical protein D9M69_540730 [compost metagenome]
MHHQQRGLGGSERRERHGRDPLLSGYRALCPLLRPIKRHKRIGMAVAKLVLLLQERDLLHMLLVLYGVQDLKSIIWNPDARKPRQRARVVVAAYCNENHSW